MANRVFIKYKNKKVTVRELSELSGLSPSAVAARRRRHPEATGEELLEMSRCKYLTDENGVTKTIKDWADDKGCSPDWFRVTLKTKSLAEVLASMPRNRTSASRQDNVDITDLEFDPMQHLKTLYSQGLSFFDIHRRMVSARMFDDLGL